MQEKLPANVRPLRAGILPEKAPTIPSIDDIVGGSGGKQQALALNMMANMSPARRKVDYDGSPLDPNNYRVPKFARVEKWLCPTCHWETDGVSDFGSLKQMDGSIIPCPSCYPPVKRAKARKKVDGLIQAAIKQFKLSGPYNLPIDGQTLQFKLYPAFGDQQAKSIIYKFINGKIINLSIHGEPGRGKTGLAISALHSLNKDGYQTLFLPVLQYLDLLREDNNYQTQYKSEIKDIAHMVEILFLDDLGAESPTKATIRDIQELIEVRHASGLKTMITSNMSIEALGMYWELPEYARTGFQPGSRITSRLRGWYEQYEISGPDLR